MDEKAIYRKTAKGQEEISTRSHHLPARLRTLLVMVDGRNSGAELLLKGKAFGDPAAFMEQLIAEGFIEAVEGAAPPVSAPAAAGPDPALKAIVQFASHQLIDRLGPSADALTGMLDACRSRDELAEAIGKCRDAIQAMAGKRKAEEFWTLVSARLAEA